MAIGILAVSQLSESRIYMDLSDFADFLFENAPGLFKGKSLSSANV